MDHHHTLTIETPTIADYQNGAAGDTVVAQCSCGRYEFSTSTDEAAYWHWMHRATPNATPFYLLSKLVDQPMPKGWTEPADTPAEPKAHVCIDCSGQGSTEFYGVDSGRFYHMGSRRTCTACGGLGTLNTEQARKASAERITVALGGI